MRNRAGFVRGKDGKVFSGNKQIAEISSTGILRQGVSSIEVQPRLNSQPEQSNLNTKAQNLPDPTPNDKVTTVNPISSEQNTISAETPKLENPPNIDTTNTVLTNHNEISTLDDKLVKKPQAIEQKIQNSDLLILFSNLKEFAQDKNAFISVTIPAVYLHILSVGNKCAEIPWLGTPDYNCISIYYIKKNSINITAEIYNSETARDFSSNFFARSTFCPVDYFNWLKKYKLISAIKSCIFDNLQLEQNLQLAQNLNNLNLNNQTSQNPFAKKQAEVLLSYEEEFEKLVEINLKENAPIDNITLQTSLDVIKKYFSNFMPYVNSAAIFYNMFNPVNVLSKKQSGIFTFVNNSVLKKDKFTPFFPTIKKCCCFEIEAMVNIGSNDFCNVMMFTGPQNYVVIQPHGGMCIESICRAGGAIENLVNLVKESPVKLAKFVFPHFKYNFVADPTQYIKLWVDKINIQSESQCQQQFQNLIGLIPTTLFIQLISKINLWKMFEVAPQENSQASCPPETPANNVQKFVLDRPFMLVQTSKENNVVISITKIGDVEEFKEIKPEEKNI